MGLINKPWGSYEVLLEETNYKVKRIIVKPGQRLSLQRHQQRQEQWTIVQGGGIMTLGDEKFMVDDGSWAINIKTYEIHRIENTGLVDLVFIETQRGSYLGEDDIERLEDDYGRLGQ